MSPSRGMRGTSTNDLNELNTRFYHHSSAIARWTLHTPCGLMLPQKVLINCVDGSIIVHILHEDLPAYSIVRSNVSRTRTNLSKSMKGRMYIRTVVLTIFPTWLPLASTIPFKFRSAWRVWASTPPSTTLPVLGSRPRHPETNTNGGLTTP
jgi:hypothetical protein